MSKNEFIEDLSKIRRAYKIPPNVVLIYNVDKVLPVGYQCITKPANNDNEAKP